MTDEKIMEAVKNGDLQLASVLFERYHKPIYNFLAQLTMDRVLAEDLAQNVFFRIIKYKGSYRPGNRFQAWIYQVARNVFSDHYQHAKSRMISQTDIEEVKDSMPDAEGADDDNEREILLCRSMALLQQEQRELLVLTRFQKLKYEEVAVIMNTTVPNIKVKVHRAIAKLRECYFELEKR